MYDVIKQIELWHQMFRWNYLPSDNKPSPKRAEQILNILESIKIGSKKTLKTVHRQQHLLQIKQQHISGKVAQNKKTRLTGKFW